MVHIQMFLHVAAAAASLAVAELYFHYVQQADAVHDFYHPAANVLSYFPDIQPLTAADEKRGGGLLVLDIPKDSLSLFQAKADDRGADSQPADTLLKVVDGQDDYKVTLAPRATATVEFVGVPTAGYMWRLGDVTGGVHPGEIKPVRRSTDDMPAGAVGGFTTYHLSFTADTDGALQLRYSSPARGQKEVRLITVTVTVEQLQQQQQQQRTWGW